MPRNPLAEVFGYPVDNFSPVAEGHRAGKLCPFHNSASLQCTKNSATDPLGVCTVFAGEGLAITCPVWLGQDLVIVQNAAQFFFPAQTRYSTLPKRQVTKGARKIMQTADIVLAVVDEAGAIGDSGILRVPRVYTAGNLRKPVTAYLQNSNMTPPMEWPRQGYPRPDYRLSCRKLVAMIVTQTGFVQGKKTAIALQRPFFQRLPAFPSVDEAEADLAWFIYDLSYDSIYEQYKLQRVGAKYTKYKDAVKYWQRMI